jgi:2-polyprenyl-3-methyl-5-hydroxy-6-metoxy-1,4-benzoquinol methylase
MRRPTFDPAWPPDVQALYRHDLQEIWDRSIAPHVWNQYHNQLDVYFALVPGGRPLDILDVGCAQGTLALMLAEQGHRVCAMDIRQPFLDYAASRHERGDIRFVCGNGLEADPGGKFDVIFANQIVEHLVRPQELVRHLARSLKPQGRLVVTTPNGDYVRNAFPSFAEIEPEEHEHRQFSADADGHFFAYLARELVDVFAAAGLGSVDVRFFESPWVSGHMKVRHLHRWAPRRALRLLDRATLRLPVVGRHLAHQLMIVGTAP